MSKVLQSVTVLSDTGTISETASQRLTQNMSEVSFWAELVKSIPIFCPPPHLCFFRPQSHTVTLSGFETEQRIGNVRHESGTPMIRLYRGRQFAHPFTHYARVALPYFTVTFTFAEDSVPSNAEAESVSAQCAARR